MIYEIVCPDCGRVVRVNIPAIERKNAEIAELKARIEKLTKPTEMPDFFMEIFN